MALRVRDGADAFAEDRVRRVEFNANPVQHAFIHSRPRGRDGSTGADCFFSRFGEGKTAGLCWASFLHQKQYAAGKPTHLFIRDTWVNLKATTLVEFFKWFPPGECGTWREGDRLFTWSVGEMKGQVQFIGLDDENDTTKVMGRPIAGVFVDEPAPAIGETQGVPQFVVEMCMGRLRQSPKVIDFYPVKLATNNPDESHWTYEKFVNPGTDGWIPWQTREPENMGNLPRNYYSGMRSRWRHRPDLVRRFVEGGFGFQQLGESVTPEWDDAKHLAVGLAPLCGHELVLFWDFWHNPACIIAQVQPNGQLFCLESHVGHGVGVEELIEDTVGPVLWEGYKGYRWRHIGDPSGKAGDQSNTKRSAVRVLRQVLGGVFVPGPVSLDDRLIPTRALLRRTLGGEGLVRVDRENCRDLWFALRGGWHRKVHKGGITSPDPVKNEHSHAGDAFSYGVAKLYPVGRAQRPTGKRQTATPRYFGRHAPPDGLRIPPEARTIKPPPRR